MAPGAGEEAAEAAENSVPGPGAEGAEVQKVSEVRTCC
jgi:hypothetical protein